MRANSAEFTICIMRLDHLSYAAGPDGLVSTAQRIGELLGTTFVDGGVHPRFGTRNMVLPLAGGTYLEVVEVLDHPASDKAPFGQAVRARSALGGGWLGWVVAVDDIALVEQRLGREAVAGNRHRPDGIELRWKQIGVNGLIADPQLPFFIAVGGARRAAPEPRRRRLASTWPASRSPATRSRVSEWLGEPVEAPLEDVKVEWVAPHGTPGVVAAQVSTAARPRPDLSAAVCASRTRRRPGRAPTSGTTPRPTRSRTAPSTPTAGSRRRCARCADWAGRDVLDIGCGTGFHLPRFARTARR